MKYIIILGDGMADRPVKALDYHTPLQVAYTPAFDFIARNGKTGLLKTIPEGFKPGSEIANMSILGYDVTTSFEGRGSLEAASIGYDLRADEMAMRCNIISVSDEGLINNHHGGELTTTEGHELIKFLQKHLGNDRIKFIPGTQYRHLLIIHNADKNIFCNPPHDFPGKQWCELLTKPVNDSPLAQETSQLINNLILDSYKILEQHLLNKQRKKHGLPLANIIWPWSPGYRPNMEKFSSRFPTVKKGAVISAVDLIKGIGRYAGFDIIHVEGATGLYNTNYEGKTQAAINALKENDFVFLHVEATDEASHDGDQQLKIKTIQYLDSRIVKPIIDELKSYDTPVRVALLPDHPTSVESRLHLSDPVPFAIWGTDIIPDGITSYSENDCAGGAYGVIEWSEFMDIFINSKN